MKTLRNEDEIRFDGLKLKIDHLARKDKMTYFISKNKNDVSELSNRSLLAVCSSKFAEQFNGLVFM